jgi:hypothetical protein
LESQRFQGPFARARNILRFQPSKQGSVFIQRVQPGKGGAAVPIFAQRLFF